jgi:hypothetical protein
MLMIEWLLPLLSLASADPAQTSCQAIAGWHEVLAQEESRWIVIGEMHGNNESPDTFVEAVCLTAQHRRVVVALEQPDFAQPAIDAFLASDGGEAAQQAFLADQIWHWEFKDGRSSQAMFRLFRRLHAMRQTGQVERVVTFQSTQFTSPPSRAENEEHMARLVVNAGADGATVLVLVGNVHARLTEVRFGETYLPMAAHLPQDQTVSLDIRSLGGDTWGCTGQPIACGPIPMRADGVASNTPHVRLDEAEATGYSGVLDLGQPVSASGPQ